MSVDRTLSDLDAIRGAVGLGRAIAERMTGPQAADLPAEEIQRSKRQMLASFNYAQNLCDLAKSTLACIILTPGFQLLQLEFGLLLCYLAAIITLCVLRFWPNPVQGTSSVAKQRKTIPGS